VGVHVENLSINWKVLFENRALIVEGVVLTVFLHPQDRVQWRAFVNSGIEPSGARKTRRAGYLER
jgi:hypothetical protein